MSASSLREHRAHGRMKRFARRGLLQDGIRPGERAREGRVRTGGQEDEALLEIGLLLARPLVVVGAVAWNLADASTTVRRTMSTTVVARFVRVFGGQLAGLGPTPFEIGSEPTVIGRGDGCGIRLNDPKVSAVHLEVRATARGVHLRDLGSTNGTWLNGNECIEEYVHHPAQIRCGDTVFHVAPGKAIDLDKGTFEPCGSFVGDSEPMKALYQRIRRVASTDLPVLITGETGTGKELAANAIHSLSARAARPFVVLDCSTIPSELAESMLFGHERGAFTGASERRVSPFVEANEGTVFLDEVGELPPALQPKLLRVLQEGQIKPVGSNSYRRVNVRVVAATRRELGREINSGSFRSDLYFRLSVLRLEVPPLRDHKEDIRALGEHLARGMGFGDAGRRFSEESITRLREHDWPGNVRELRNVIAAACAFAPPVGPIDVTEHLSPASRRATLVRSTTHFETAREEFEKAFWQARLGSSETIAELARVTGVARSTVRAYLEKHGLRWKE